MRRGPIRHAAEPPSITRFNGLRATAGVLVLFGFLSLIAGAFMLFDRYKLDDSRYWGSMLGISCALSGVIMVAVGFTMSAVAMIAESAQESREAQLRTERLLARLVEIQSEQHEPAKHE